MSCASFADLVDWTAGVADGDALEEHLFACDSCAERAERVLALAEAVRDVTAEGGVQMSLVRALADAMQERGVTVQEFVLKADPVPCDAAHDRGIIVLRLPVAPGRVERIDLEMLGPGETLLRSVDDLAFSPGEDAVLLGQPASEWRHAPPMTVTFRLLAHADGRSVALGDFVLAHGSDGGGARR